MKVQEQKIKNILLEGGYITEEDVRKGEKEAAKSRLSFVNYLFQKNLITSDLLGQSIAEYYSLPYFDLNSNAPIKDQVLRIPEGTARKFRAVLFKEDSGSVSIATDFPLQRGLLQAIEQLFPGKEIEIGYSLEEDVEAALVYYRKSLSTRFNKIIQTQQRIAPEVLDGIIEDALAFHASDIHFEPQSKEVVIRFRVDGILHEAGRVPIGYYDNVVNHIKILSRLRIDNHFSAQDGSMRYSQKGKEIDIRISILPTLEGEKIVMRLLSVYVQNFTLSDLGLSSQNQQLLSSAAKKPFGMILVVGPTGSGKTTTLYAVIKKINRPEINITTIEDPVEYRIQGINQIQVNQQTELTFAKGLRSIVRQDPNVILVGEIRDIETAEIAINAALTGHLLLSTFHANDAATAIPRLLDMGIEPFLLTSTLELVLAQRLARKICEKCRTSFPLDRADLASRFPAAAPFFPPEAKLIFQGAGCSACNNTGFRGRIALFEGIKNTPELQDLILNRPSSAQIWHLAREQGSRSLFEDGIEKVVSGITTIEEVLRIAAPPKIQNTNANVRGF